MMAAADSEAEIEKYYYILLLIDNKPQHNLHSGDTAIQGTLASVPRVSPE